VELVNLLLGRGAHKDAQNEDGITPLYSATHFGHVDIVLTMVAIGADVSLVTKEGLAPLHLAAADGNVHLIKALVYGAWNAICRVDFMLISSAQN
jgi:ankyrin repeat protein